MLVIVIVLVPFVPCLTVNVAGDAPIVKFGVAAAVTVSESVVVAIRLPDVPVMVTVDVPVVAVLLAVSVRTLVPVVGFVPNAALTPLGKSGRSQRHAAAESSHIRNRDSAGPARATLADGHAAGRIRKRRSSASPIQPAH